MAHGGTNMALLAGVLGMSEGDIPRLEQDLGCLNAIDFADHGEPLVRLMNLSAHDPTKARQRESGFSHLRRTAGQRAGARVRSRSLADETEV